MKLKNHLSLLLAIALCFTIFSGCGTAASSIASSVNSESTTTPVGGLLDVYVDVTVDGSSSSGKPSFNISTNLPDNTELILTLSGKNNYYAQSKVTVSGGSATSSSFSDNGSTLSGSYTLRVSMSYPKFQNSSVTDVIGMAGEYMTGDCVVSEDGENRIQVEYPFDF